MASGAVPTLAAEVDTPLGVAVFVALRVGSFSFWWGMMRNVIP